MVAHHHHQLVLLRLRFVDVGTVLLFLFTTVLLLAKASPPPAAQTKNSAEQQPQQQWDEDNIQAIADDALAYAQMISLTLLPNNHNGRSDISEIAPFSLFPSPFPQKLFEMAQRVQTAYNLMYFRISNDYDFLTQTFEPIANTNEKIRKMLDIIKQKYAEGVKQTKSIVLARSDYMCHVVETDNKETDKQTYELKQIEMNAGQIGGLSAAGRATDLHRRTMLTAGIKVRAGQLPDNEAEFGAVEVLYKAWKAFDNPKAIILLIASRTSANRYGHRHIEYGIERLSKNKATMVRRSLEECGGLIRAGKLTLNADDHSLVLEGRTVAVVYKINEPKKYSEIEWETLLLIERSTAILCPTIGLDLATQKKVQQALSKPGMVEHYLPDLPEIVPLVRSTFARLWSLDEQDEESQQAVKDAIEHPENYVLKPNLEGGGHNFFNEQVREKLLTFSDQERAAHILMEKLHPMKFKNFMMRPFYTPRYGPLTTELGIFGFLLGDSSTVVNEDGTTSSSVKVLHNVQRGHFLRSKLATVNEGGVSLGTGVYDSPYLIP